MGESGIETVKPLGLSPISSYKGRNVPKNYPATAVLFKGSLRGAGYSFKMYIKTSRIKSITRITSNSSSVSIRFLSSMVPHLLFLINTFERGLKLSFFSPNKEEMKQEGFCQKSQGCRFGFEYWKQSFPDRFAICRTEL